MAKKKKTDRSVERTARAAEKAAKKNPKVFFTIVAILLVALIVAGVCWYFLVYKKIPAGGGIDAGTKEDIVTADMSVHFLELGNKKTGDCTLIKVGNTEVLIDAGSNNTSAETIVPYIASYCTDGVLDYVIATHAHEDHIGAFYSTSSRKGVFESFECKTIIDFPMTKKNASSANSVYGRYCASRDKEVEAGAVHYNAMQCWNETDGAKRTYELSEKVSFSILYQKYYEELESGSDENNYSVCTLFRNGTDNFLFTGDLEEEGESSLVDNNDLPHCILYKAGHHGSNTSSHEKMLKKITPKYVCVCCCAGSPEYTRENNNTFPTQDFIDRIAKYTDQIFVTTLATDVDLAEKEWNFTSMNGNIVIYYGKKEEGDYSYKIWCSNNMTILKETEWFKANRTWSGV